jgi:uncharacterized RDD family membrane protein YckC
MEQGGAGALRYGGFWRRVVASLIDAVIVNAVMAVLSFVIPVYEKVGMGDISVPESVMGIGAELEYNSLGAVILFLGSWLYAALMESGPKQATLGKMALSLQVIDLDGDRVSFAQASGRFFAKILSFGLFLIGFLMVAFTPRKQGLHDMLAKTLVIRRSRG